ncbi:MAG: adenosyl-hopene transferase HpnH [Planctomycetota bacterium]|nr:adenosyl-hopene transferase HpnH [Planctomycetaceae bacterium]MDQ3332608.1 adenosyl-hopene transferase HpnH [Planctomycetota bacterium]
MGVPISQMWTVASYVMRQRLTGRKRYPLVLMLEPLFRCNLACAGCGKIQHPKEVLKRHLSPEECFRAVEECGAPIVSIPGGEPLLHPEIAEIVAGLVARKKYVYLCTNALLLEKKLDEFTPSKYLSFSIHLDGPREEHDEAVCREGVYDVVIPAIRAAIARGFRVTTNSTLFNHSDPERVRELFDTLADLGVEGTMVSPGYPYEKAPDQEHFLHRRQTETLFRKVFANANRRWRFNQSPLFLEFLRGNWDLECTPWGMPTYNLFGWQKPCYLIQGGYCDTFAELMESTRWEEYGAASGNPKCVDCMVHSGYEATAVAETFGSLRGLARAARVTFAGLGEMRDDMPSSTPPRPSTRPTKSTPTRDRELVQLQV